MIKLETDTLKIIPLSLENFELLIENYEQMEENLELVKSGYKENEYFLKAMRMALEKAINDKENHIWYTNWQIVLKEESIAIGSIGFKGIPNENGEVEIGYGIQESYRCKGYTTNAVKTICKWAFSQHEVLSIVAETDKDNVASQRVLERARFKKFKERQESIWWRLI